MSKREKLSDAAIAAFIGAHAGWTAEGGTIARTFEFDDYAAGIGFVVRVGFAAERHDHHPDLVVLWRKVKVAWSTHDRGGVTDLDVEMALLTEELHTG